MTKYGKLIDGFLRIAPKRVEYEGKQIINPRPEILLALGYKPIVYTPIPEEIEGYYWVSEWEETETEIVQMWVSYPIPDPETEE